MEDYGTIGLDDGKLEAMRQDGIEYRYRASYEGSAEHILGILGYFSGHNVPSMSNSFQKM